MKRALAVILVCLLFSSSFSNASAATKTTSKTSTYYSWAGIKIFSIGVTGWYDTDGTKVTGYNSTTATPISYLLWSNSNPASWWTSTSNTAQAQCYGQAKFCLGVTTDELTIGIQSGTWGVTATGKP